MQEHHDTHKAQTGHQDGRRTHLQTGRIIGIELQYVGTGTSGATTGASTGSGGSSCCSTSLSSLLKTKESGGDENDCLNADPTTQCPDAVGDWVRSGPFAHLFPLL